METSQINLEQPILVPPSNQVPKTSHLIPVVISSLVTTIILVGSYFLFIKNTPKNVVSTPTPSPLASVLPSSDPTANWYTYTDQKYKYSFKYPSSWTDLTTNEEKAQGSFTIETDIKERIHGVIFKGSPDYENDRKNNGTSRSYILNDKSYLFVTYVECDGPGCKMGSKQMDTFESILFTIRIDGQLPKSVVTTINDDYGFTFDFTSSPIKLIRSYTTVFDRPVVLNCDQPVIEDTNVCPNYGIVVEVYDIPEFGGGCTNENGDNLYESITIANNKYTYCDNKKDSIISQIFIDRKYLNQKSYSIMAKYNDKFTKADAIKLISTIQFTK